MNAFKQWCIIRETVLDTLRTCAVFELVFVAVRKMSFAVWFFVNYMQEKANACDRKDGHIKNRVCDYVNKRMHH
uniref:Innexin n=1 Tax=Panagrellus redivivus TaxID=6233 RepID=A0A7E4V3U2_PANRE